MDIVVYKKEYKLADSIDNFLDFYYGIHMTYLASDLLKEGLSPKQISDAVFKAIKVGKSSGLVIREHFMPLFTRLGSDVISDCKLSKMGYGLVLLNANPELAIVGEWQVNVMKAKLN